MLCVLFLLASTPPGHKSTATSWRHHPRECNRNVIYAACNLTFLIILKLQIYTHPHRTCVRAPRCRIPINSLSWLGESRPKVNGASGWLDFILIGFPGGWFSPYWPPTSLSVRLKMEMGWMVVAEYSTLRYPDP